MSQRFVKIGAIQKIQRFLEGNSFPQKDEQLRKIWDT